MKTVFWSWQSDLDARVTRDVVRDALAAAIANLHAELEERAELTSDTKGVPGSPDIVATILAKIEAAAVFVGDVTPIATSSGGKVVANPNVLIELGYAKRALGLERIVLVWNTAFEGATPERLPFDMRGRRAPIGFRLPPGADRPALAEARGVLTATLTDALRASLAVTVRQREQPEVQWQAPSSHDRSLWFDPAQPLLINEGGVAGSRSIAATRYFYARVVPSVWPAAGSQVQERHAPLLGRTDGYSWGSAKGGMLTYPGSLRTPDQSRRQLAQATIQFRSTGEIWAIKALVAPSDDRKAFDADNVIGAWNDFLEAAIPHLQRQGAIGPFRVRIGATRLDGLGWVSGTGWGGKPQALEDEVEAVFELVGASEGERLAAFDKAWGEIALAFGLIAPDRPTLVRQIRSY